MRGQLGWDENLISEKTSTDRNKESMKRDMEGSFK
jgi:hypothetical protein